MTGCASLFEATMSGQRTGCLCRYVATNPLDAAPASTYDPADAVTEREESVTRLTAGTRARAPAG
jgi:hypothetical protein